MADKYKHTKAELRAMERDLKRILGNGDELELMKIPRKLGIKDEDPRFPQNVKLFRELRARKT
jgi:hypothetical protein